MTSIDYRTHDKLTDNGDGTWTVSPGFDGRTWTIRTTGGHASWGEHFTADPEGYTRGVDGAGHFSGGFDQCAFNCVGWEF